VPDRRPVLFPSRTHIPAPRTHSSRPQRPLRTASLRLRLTLSGSALALLALAGGTLASNWSAGPAHSGATVAGAQAGSRSGATRSLALDAFASHSSAPQASGGGGTGGGGTARARHRATARAIARGMLRRFRWSRRQFRYLNWLWNRESGWNVYAENPYSAAYGIPQAVPGSKMGSAGPNWRSNARTQIRWGLRYIRDRYGSPRRAWAHEVGSGWY
jgi:hypothetical protein